MLVAGGNMVCKQTVQGFLIQEVARKTAEGAVVIPRMSWLKHVASRKLQPLAVRFLLFPGDKKQTYSLVERINLTRRYGPRGEMASSPGIACLSSWTRF